MPPVYGFLTGQLADNMEGRKKLLVRWKEAGHLIGNHGFSHLDLSKTNSADYIADIAKNEPLLIDYASTIKELKVFRYPFLMEGDSHDKRYAVRSYLSRRQYQIAQVSVDFQDWHFYEAWMKCQGQEDNQRQLEDEFILFAKQRLTTYHQVGQYIFGANRELPHILLLHLTPLTAKLLDRLLSEFTKMGVRWISADQAIRHPLYQEDTALEMKSGGMGFLDQALQSRKLKFKWPKNHILPKNKLLSLCP